jgi:outer membrane protein assembly factor BamD
MNGEDAPMTSPTRTFRCAVALLVVLGLALPACRGRKVEIAPDVASSDEALFKLGEASVKKDPEKALLYLRQVIDSFPKSFYAQRAKLLIADTYYKKGDEGNMILAAAEYREFINLYPYSPSAAYCQYQIGMTFFRKALKAGRDQAKTIQALAEFKKVVTAYPASDQARAAQEKIKDCEERLAEHALIIGRHYHRVRALKAATSRLGEIVTSYPNFSGMDAVYFYLGDSYFLWNKPAESAPYFTKLITDYPKSKYVKDARERLKEIEARPQAPK